MKQPMMDWPETCVEHTDSPAIALCIQCGAYTCRECRRVDPQGLALCAKCDRQAASAQSLTRDTASGNLLSRFFRTSKAALLQPGRFIREIDLEGPVGPALGFGIVCSVIGQLALFVWVLLLLRPIFEERTAVVAEDLQLSVRAFQLLTIGTMPLTALLRIGIYALLLRLGVALIAAPNAYRYRNYVRLFSFASVGYLLLLVPLDIGIALAIVFLIVFCGQALRYHHNLSRVQTFIAIVPFAVGMFLLEASNIV